MRVLTILVTGAAGLIGSEVTARLAADGHSVIALVHSEARLVRNDGRVIEAAPLAGAVPPGAVRYVRGDITRPRLGLPDDVHGELRALADRVVHGAALTDFGRSPSLYDDINVTGTANVLEFCRSNGGDPLPLIHISTAYVAGERTGKVTEDEFDAGQRFGSHYEKSKFQAERLVRKHCSSGGPAAIVRPSIVVGTERSGIIREFKHIYVVLKLFTEGRVRSVPGHFDATVDLVPIDHVADVVVAATTRFDDAVGRTFHATGRGPHTLRDFSDVLAEYPSFHVPRYVPPASFSAEGLPQPERAYYERVVRLYESYFQRRLTFDDRHTAALVDRRPSAGGKAYLRRLLDHCVKVGYLGAPSPGVDEVLSTPLAPPGRRSEDR